MVHSIDEKAGTFDLEFTGVLHGAIERGLQLTQLQRLPDFDVAAYEASEKMKKEKRRQQAKACREKKKEKEKANAAWKRQWDAFNEKDKSGEVRAAEPAFV